MRKASVLVMVATALTLALGMSPVRAQSTCRGECDFSLDECRQACWDAQTFDDCTSACQSYYVQCISSCE